MGVDGGLPLRNVLQCRICHDEDEPSNMETPCACCGSLKYAHRRCVQMWCNEKGNTVCEICQQPFKHGYSVPPPRLPFAVIPVRLREPWEFPRDDQYNHPSIDDAERNFFEHSFDEYPTPTASIICCRIIATIVLSLPLLSLWGRRVLISIVLNGVGEYSFPYRVLLVLRHTLPIVLNGVGEYSFPLYTLLMLRTIGILLPMLVMLKACSAIRYHRRYRQTAAQFHVTPSDEENGFDQQQLPVHLIHVQ